MEEILSEKPLDMSAKDFHLLQYRSRGCAKERYARQSAEFYLGAVVTDNVPKRSKHLCLGTNDGVVSQLLRGKGCIIHGLELIPELWEEARAKGIFCRQGDVAEAATIFAGKQYDTIDMLEVLEHLDNPQAALAAVKHLLKPKGLAIISVPNREGFKKGLGAYHFNFYTAMEFGAELRQCFCSSFHISIAGVPYHEDYCKSQGIDPEESQWFVAFIRRLK